MWGYKTKASFIIKHTFNFTTVYVWNRLTGPKQPLSSQCLREQGSTLRDRHSFYSSEASDKENWSYSCIK